MQRRIDIPARQTPRPFLRGLELAREQRRERDRAPGLDHESVLVPGEADGIGDFGVADGQSRARRVAEGCRK